MERDETWLRFVDSSGRSYWCLLRTGHSQWEPPVGAKTVKVPQIQFQFSDRVVVIVGWVAAPLSRRCRLCLATSPSWRLLEEFPLLRALRRAIRTWKCGLRLRARIFQSFGVWVLPLEYVVFGTRALLGSTVDTCSTRGFWRTFTYFLRVVNSDPRRLLSIPQNGEVCTVDASSCSVSSRGSHFGSGHYLYELFI